MNAPLMPPRPSTPLLDRVRVPSDLRNFSGEQLRQVADELRAETIDAVSTTGGHLGASLGVVELTVALHAVFDTPADRVIWDVGHQCYPHKIITGRRDRIRTLRQPGGLSGFTRRSESEYDPFGAAHSSTSISAGLGMAVASELLGTPRTVIAVIGDGAHERRHGLRGDEQRRLHEGAAGGGAERQRDVDRAAGGGDERLPDAAAELQLLPQPARPGVPHGAALPDGRGQDGQAGGGICPRHS